MAKKNVTLSFDETMILKGREVAAQRGMTLNEMLRDLPEREVNRERGSRFLQMVEQAKKEGRTSDGSYLSREEIYEGR